MIQIHSLLFFLSLLHWNGTQLGEFYGSRYVSTKKIVDLISKKLNGGVKMTTIENELEICKKIQSLVFGDELEAHNSLEYYYMLKR